MFRHPLVYDPISGVHVLVKDMCDDGPNDDGAPSSHPRSPIFMMDEKILMEYGPYRDLVSRRDALYIASWACPSPRMWPRMWRKDSLIPDDCRCGSPERLMLRELQRGARKMGAVTGEKDPHEDKGGGAESGKHTQDSGRLQF
jgi:hypothetical protein